MDSNRKNTKPVQYQVVDVAGKLPPQSIELEKGILGAIMQDNRVMPEIADILVPEAFYLESHIKIYIACYSLYKRNITPDLLSVSNHLKETGELEEVGGPFYISVLTNHETRNIEQTARLIQQFYILREYIKLSSEITNLSYQPDADCFEVTNYIEKQLTGMAKNFTVGKIETMETLWQKAVFKNDILIINKGLSGIPTGFKDINTITGGWQNGNLIIIAGRPKMGKTALVTCMARNASVDYTIPGVIFSMEMSSLEIGTRLFSLESSVSINEFSRTGIQPDILVYVDADCKKLIKAPLYIDDTPALSLQELRSKARKLKREKDIKFIVVDYLQLMSGDRNEKGNREQVVSSISRGLKQLAKELEMPVIALSQLNRAVETRGGDKRPQLSDLRESGAIEQDADMVIFVHRPEFYGIMEYEGGESTKGIAEVIISAHRNGGTGTIKLRWIDYLTKFTELDIIQQPVKDFTEGIKSESNKWDFKDDGTPF